jgi:hypothetical protein
MVALLPVLPLSQLVVERFGVIDDIPSSIR